MAWGNAIGSVPLKVLGVMIVDKDKPIIEALKSAFGTKRTWRVHRKMSAFDPKRNECERGARCSPVRPRALAAGWQCARAIRALSAFPR